MKLTQLWHRMLTRPAPRRPVQQFFAIMAGGLGGRVMASLLVPSSWAIDQIPIRFDLPYRAAAFGALIGFTSTGLMLLGPLGRKIFLITAVVLLPILFVTGIALVAPVFSEPTIDFDKL